jgi:hypothetical protein
VELLIHYLTLTNLGLAKKSFTLTESNQRALEVSSDLPCFFVDVEMIPFSTGRCAASFPGHNRKPNPVTNLACKIMFILA